ncbi:hypothetical protein ACN4EG_27535 [Alkalinema pantanalense CENA528]|uniref:hypothetical protein n=1 Tax=Alkalinema pantanalense TaxID=1620705 RepID=UPI003D6F7132
MGWDLELLVWCKSDKLPSQRLLDLVNHLGKSPLFGRISRVEVKKSPHYFKGDYITFKQLDGKGLPRDEITRIVEQYTNQPVAFEAWWRTHSYHEYLEENIYGRRVRKIVEEPWRIVIEIVNRDKSWAGHPCGIDMFWDLGNMGYLSPAMSGERAKLNILAVIYQLEVLIEADVATIHAHNLDNERHPRTFYLAYHCDADGFRQDLTLWTQYIFPQPQLTKEQVIDIAQACEEIEYLEVAGGVLIFHQDLVDGNLASFYDAIVEWLTNGESQSHAIS